MGANEKLNHGIIKPGYQTANIVTYKYLRPFQKKLRKNTTLAESFLWLELQNKKTGYKFRRQHIIADFIVDFVCLKQKLVVEVDGEIHLNQIDEDLVRTQRPLVKGYRVIRFTNEQVLRDAAGIANE